VCISFKVQEVDWDVNFMKIYDSHQHNIALSLRVCSAPYSRKVNLGSRYYEKPRRPGYSTEEVSRDILKSFQEPNCDINTNFDSDFKNMIKINKLFGIDKVVFSEKRLSNLMV